MKNPAKRQPTAPVRITLRRYDQVRKSAKANGHTISWLLNYIIDLYFQTNAKAPLGDQKDGATT